MEFPTKISTVLNTKAWIWRLLLIIWIAEVIALTSICFSLQSHSDAPGVQDAPGNSRIGKPEPADRGASFQSLLFFEHYGIVPYQDRYKLNFSSNIHLIYETKCTILQAKQYLVMLIGYARVSTEDQDLGRQIDALNQAGCEVIYQEKISGGRTTRPELDKMLNSLQSGDVVIIQKLDRLGRSLSHLMELIKLFGTKEIGIKSLSDSFDTTTKQGMFIFQIMGAISEFERAMISERIKHALAFKKSQGVKIGRPKKDQKTLITEIVKLNEIGIKPDAIWKLLSITKSKYYRLLKQS